MKRPRHRIGPRLRAVVIWELPQPLAPAAADSSGQDPALEQVSEAESPKSAGSSTTIPRSPDRSAHVAAPSEPYSCDTGEHIDP